MPTLVSDVDRHSMGGNPQTHNLQILYCDAGFTIASGLWKTANLPLQLVPGDRVGSVAQGITWESE